MKKKICSSCDKEVYLFKSKPPLCKSCYLKSYSKPINKVSKNHQKTLDEYAPERKKFLEEHPYCQIKLLGCTHQSTCIHHKKGKVSRELYLDKRYWMASCIYCNGKLEELGEKAYELGLKIKNHA